MFVSVCRILLFCSEKKMMFTKHVEQVMSVKALGIALKLTFSGTNQLFYPQTWVFTLVVLTCVITQLNYLNKVSIIFRKSLDVFLGY